MKLSTDFTFPLIVLMTFVELFDFVTARPAMPQGKNDLRVLYQDMRKLFNIVSQEKHENKLNDFEQPLTSLPSLDFRTEDLKTLEVSSTLEQLYSGLKSFKFHLDWIQHEQDKLDIDYSKTKNSHLINLIDRVLKQIETPISELVHPSLPQLKTAWNLKQANLEIKDKLYYFCHWYIRALLGLKPKQ
ncbi:uncharacterized protein il11b [Pimephales promelas]|uniref:uncharacterized protein il11b n=1 Tax=Pimephales promelas TaxID=90988 RepID=UPI001955518B|nr:uncharacterized protein il11b [Pimephales promelas]KAG1948672.1 hypothetical protein F2P79_012284 [Pimephales promelas]